MGRRIITLTTDFGTADSYVAAMKGVILSINPEVRLVDLSHELAVHDVVGAALFLAGACKYFPEDTIHLAVIDPGVGTSRRAICIRTARSYYVVPDNGVASLAAQAEGPYDTVTTTNTEYHRTDRPSATFHGRDIFAPVAAHLSLGVDYRVLGPPVADPIRVEIPPVNRPAPGVLAGEIVHIDRFGNLVTNISRQTWLEIEDNVGETTESAVQRLSRGQRRPGQRCTADRRDRRYACKPLLPPDRRLTAVSHSFFSRDL